MFHNQSTPLPFASGVKCYVTSGKWCWSPSITPDVIISFLLEELLTNYINYIYNLLKYTVYYLFTFR